MMFQIDLNRFKITLLISVYINMNKFYEEEVSDRYINSIYLNFVIVSYVNERLLILTRLLGYFLADFLF